LKRFFTYTYLRLKAVLRTFPAMLIMTALLILSTGSMLFIQASAMQDTAAGDEDARVGIGLVGIDSSPYLKMGIQMLMNTDSSKNAVNFITYDSTGEAEGDLRDGTLSALIVIPDGVMDALLAGESAKMTLILPGSGAGLGPLLIRELSDAISRIIGQMETSSNALMLLYENNGVTDVDDINAAQTDLLYTSVEKFFKRRGLFKVQYTSTDNSLSVESYYLCSMLLLFFLLMGVMCAGHYIRNNNALGRLLRERRLGAAAQTAAEYISLLGLLLLTWAIFSVPMGLALSRMQIKFVEVERGLTTFFQNFMLFSLKCVPVIVLAAAIDLLIYELSDSLISGIMMHFLTMVLLSLLSGVFFPVTSMPAVVRRISKFIPTAYALDYMQALLHRNGHPLSWLWVILVWSAGIFAAAAVIRSYKIRFGKQ